MKREIELAKLQLIADQFEASGVMSISNYSDSTKIIMNAKMFYQLFGDRTSDDVIARFTDYDSVRVETQVGKLRYVCILLIEEGSND